MNKIERIEYFLKSMMYVRENRNFSLSCTNVYSSLISFDIDNKDRNVDLGISIFDRWINNFKDKKNINVFVDPNWSYFCQFTNNKKEVLNKEEQIKIYIPLDSNHIVNGVERIFSFLASKNISHLSKVSKHIRFDDIVIRVSNSFDAEIISNFIKNDSYIQEGLIKHNPFAVEKESISYACDKNISYNSMVSTLVANYINYSYDLKQDVNIESFKKYIEMFYIDVFTNHNYQKLSNDLFHFSIRLLTNYKRVIELIYNNLSPNYTYGDYLEFFEKNTKDYHRKSELKKKEETQGSYDEITLLKRSLIEFGKKKKEDGTRVYSYKDTILQIYEYFKTNDPIYITKSGGIRYDMVKCNYRDILIEYMSSNNLEFNDVILKTKKSILDDAINSLREKYGNEYDVSYAIKRLLILHDYSGFTNYNNARDNLICGVSIQDVKEIITKELGINYELFSSTDRDVLIEAYLNNDEKKYSR